MITLLIILAIPLIIAISDEFRTLIIDCLEYKERNDKSKKDKALGFKTRNVLEFEKTLREFEMAMKKSSKIKSDPFDEMERRIEEFNMNRSNSQVNKSRPQSLNTILNKISDLKETLKTPKSETLSKNALDLVRLFEMSKSDIHRKEVMNQLEIIKKALQEDIEIAKLPGTNSYIEEQLAINRRYLSVAKDT